MTSGLEVVRFRGGEDDISWQYPSDELTMYSRVVVEPGQEAVFILEGRISQIFGPGTHTLSSGNIPFLKKIYSMAFGGRTPFPAEVTFLRKSQIHRKWGTAEPIRVEDQASGFILLRAHGVYHVRISDSRTFLQQFPDSHACSGQNLDRVFRSVIAGRLAIVLAEAFTAGTVRADAPGSAIDDLSRLAAQRLQKDFTGYGIELIDFLIESIETVH